MGLLAAGQSPADKYAVTGQLAVMGVKIEDRAVFGGARQPAVPAVAASGHRQSAKAVAMYTEWPQLLRNSGAAADKAAASFLIDLGERPLPKLCCRGWDVRRIAGMWVATFHVSSRESVQALWIERFGVLGVERDVLWRFGEAEHRIHRPVLCYVLDRTVSFGFVSRPSPLLDHGNYIQV